MKYVVDDQYSSRYHGQRTMLNFEALDWWVWNESLWGVEAALTIRLLVRDKVAAVGSPDEKMYVGEQEM